MLLVHLFVLYVLVVSFFSSSWCRGLAAVCDCGTPWAFLLTVLVPNIVEKKISPSKLNINYLRKFILHILV